MSIAYSVIALLFGFSLLIWGADRFVNGAAGLAKVLNVSPLIIGVSIVGFGTSAPEMLVSALSAIDGAPQLGIGNAIGSNIANIGLVLAITILFYPLTIRGNALNQEFIALTGIMSVSTLLMIDGTLSFSDGALLLTGFIVALAGMTYQARQQYTQASETDDTSLSVTHTILLLAFGLIALLVGAKLLVSGATDLARLLGVSELIIGLTIIAIGTSLPELATTLTAAKKQEHSMAIGNILGSNMFNLLAVLAMPGLILPSQIDLMVLHRDIPIMTILFILLFITIKFGQPGYISRQTGGILLIIYLAYSTCLGYLTL